VPCGLSFFLSFSVPSFLCRFVSSSFSPILSHSSVGMWLCVGVRGCDGMSEWGWGTVCVQDVLSYVRLLVEKKK
jgi:hypothetical protein